MIKNEITESKNITHEQSYSLHEAIQRIISKIKNRGDLPYVSISKQLEWVDQLSESTIGRFLLERGGLNGYWTDFVIKHPMQGRLTGLNEKGAAFNALESFLLNQAPFALATQERFTIFKSEIQKRIRSKSTLASIPCGLMADLLDLDFTDVKEISLVGIDLDIESLESAKSEAQKRKLSEYCTFFQKDAWKLSYVDEFDLITSNGLSIYEPNDEKVINLYEGFFRSLKPGGYLITSFLTPPPTPESKGEWDLAAVNMQDALLQKIILLDILDSKWQIFRSEAKVFEQLQKAGFGEIEVIYDRAHIFPTVIAKRKCGKNL